MAEETNETTVELDPGVEERIAALIEAGRPADCVELSEVDALVQEIGLSDDQAELVQQRIEAAGLSIEDDCGKAAEQAGYRNEDLAETTTDALQLFFNELRKYPLLTKEEEVELAQAIERGDLEAKERLINSNLRLVVSNARRYMRQDLNLLDLIQEGILGLIRASEKFDWRKGYKFSTYAGGQTRPRSHHRRDRRGGRPATRTGGGDSRALPGRHQPRSTGGRGGGRILARDAGPR